MGHFGGSFTTCCLFFPPLSPNVTKSMNYAFYELLLDLYSGQGVKFLESLPEKYIPLSKLFAHSVHQKRHKNILANEKNGHT